MVHPSVLLNIKHPRFGYLMDGAYDGDRGVAVLKFLDPKTQTFFNWYDNTGHISYLLTDAERLDIDVILGDERGYLGTEPVSKYDAVLDKKVVLRKVFADNPLAIGGDSRRKNSFRDLLQHAGATVWEAWIRYYQRYCYDRGFEMGMPYLVTEERVVPFVDEATEKKIKTVLGELQGKHGVSYTPELHHWVRIFEYILPTIKATSVDIEVLPEDPNRIPNAIVAAQEVIAISFMTSTGKRIILLLKRQGVKVGEGYDEIDAEVMFFDTERGLITAAFSIIKKYPLVVTFNGDDFDFMYLYNRAKKLGIPQRFNPIYLVRKQSKLKHGIHIDLYPFFKNKSIKNYAFKAKYKDFKLDDISKALLGKGKLMTDSEWLPIGQLTYADLGRYCLRDAELTYELLTFKNNVTINLMLSLTRMANLPIGELTRHKISDWIKSTFYYLLLKKNILIPSQEQLNSKGKAQTKAKIKGKKYEGAIVRDPRPGIHFNVKVLDFQSLYPDEVDKRNLGYATINCNHLECRENVVPYTTHWVCTKNRAIEADVIGSLKDIRVIMYKPMARDKSLTEEQRTFYSCLEQAIKVYLNASYGVFGFPKFALYCPPVPESVTAYARRDMTAICDKAESIDCVILMGDTDSTALRNPTEEQIKELQEWATAELNLDLGIDKVYRYAVISHRKKNYLGVFENGEADIKGLTGMKRHIPAILKKPFYEITDILGRIEKQEEFEPAKRSIWEIARSIYFTLRDGKWNDIKELSFHTRLGRPLDSYQTNPQHVKAARMLVDMGHDIKEGDIIHYVKTKSRPGVAPLVDANSVEIDAEGYIGQWRSILDQIIEPLGIDFASDVIGEMTLDNYPSDVGIKKPSMLINLTDFLPQNSR